MNDAEMSHCWLCPGSAPPKAMWSTVLDGQVANSVCKMLDLNSTDFIEFFSTADYCGSCQEFVLQIDFLVRRMEKFKIQLFKCRRKLSQCLMDNLDICVGEMREQFDIDNADVTSDENQPPEVGAEKDTNTRHTSYEYDTGSELLQDDFTVKIESVQIEDELFMEVGTDVESVAQTAPAILPESEEPAETIFTSSDSPPPKKRRQGAETVEQNVIAVPDESTSAENSFENIIVTSSRKPREVIPQTTTVDSPEIQHAPEHEQENLIFTKFKKLVPVRRLTRSITAAKTPVSYGEERSGSEPESEAESMSGDADFVANNSADSDSDLGGELEDQVNVDNTNDYIPPSKKAASKRAEKSKSATKPTTNRKSKVTRTRNRNPKSLETQTPEKIGNDKTRIKENGATTKQTKSDRIPNTSTKPRRTKSIIPPFNRILSFYQRPKRTEPRPDKKLKCTFPNCTYQCNSIKAMQSHEQDWHTKRTEEEDIKMGRFRCREAGCSFFTRVADVLKIHKLRVHQNDPRPYKCDMCNQEYKEKTGLHNHQTIAHQPEKRFICDICGKTYKRVTHLHSHFRLKHSDAERFRCSFCTKKYLFEEDWKFHENKHRRTDLFLTPGELTCVMGGCKILFENQDLLKQHVETVHDTHKTFICDICGSGLQNPWVLKLHMATHEDELPFKCSECSKGFRLKQQLQNHCETMHPKEGQVFPCKLCDQTFHCRAYLYKHNTWHRLGENANKPLAKQDRDLDD